MSGWHDDNRSEVGIGMTIIEVKLEWYLEVLTGSVAMQVSMKSYQLLKQIDRRRKF